MNWEKRVQIDSVLLPRSVVFTYPTRLSDFWSESVETVYKPQRSTPEYQSVLAVNAGLSSTTGELRQQTQSFIARARLSIRKVRDNRIPLIETQNVYVFDSRMHDLSNVAHVIHDVLAPLRFAEYVIHHEGMKSLPICVVVPRYVPNIAKRILKFAGVETIETDGRVSGNILTVTGKQNLTYLRYLEYQRYQHWSQGQFPNKLYISRRQRRKLTNESEVWAYLKSKGYHRVFMEDLPLDQQWTLLENAKHIVGIHGAGLAALALSSKRKLVDGEPRFHLIELSGAGFTTDCFRTYSAVLGGSWVGVRGRVTSAIIRDLDEKKLNYCHQFSDFDVSLESLSMALSYSASQ